MARSLSSSMLLAASLVDSLSFAINRRGYTAASRGAVSAGVVGKGGSRSGMLGKAEEEAVTKEKSWVPDPVTGNYRPIDRATEIDAVELREMALNHNVKPH